MFELEQKKLKENEEVKKSSFTVKPKFDDTPSQYEKADVEELTDFLIMPEALNSREKLEDLHNFRVLHKGLLGSSLQYMVDIKTDKIYKLEKRKLKTSVFMGKNILHKPSEIILSEIHPCFVFMEILYLETNMDTEVSKKDSK